MRADGQLWVDPGAIRYANEVADMQRPTQRTLAPLLRCGYIRLIRFASTCQTAYLGALMSE
jgi:hypothetical protein